MLHPKRPATPPTTGIDPLPGLTPWLGGKRQLAKRIAALVDRHKHTCYAEPFLGMGGVFLRRTRRPEAEAINDINGDVVTLFRVVQRHPEALAEQLALTLGARAEYDRVRRLDPAGLTDIERAARFFFLMHCGFRGKVTAPTFGASPARKSHWHLDRLLARVRAVHRRLAGVYIERLAYDAFIRLYDRPGTVFYLDPPYWGHEKDYGPGVFAPEDFARLAAILRAIEGRFVLSINDVPEIRALFGWATIERVPVTYVMGGGKRVQELLISSPVRGPVEG